MPISYKRTEVGEGIALTEITDPKFKSNLISVSFVTPTDAHNAPMNTLVMELLASSNAKLKTLAELTGELAYLYGATLSSKSRLAQKPRNLQRNTAISPKRTEPARVLDTTPFVC